MAHIEIPRQLMESLLDLPEGVRITTIFGTAFSEKFIVHIQGEGLPLEGKLAATYESPMPGVLGLTDLSPVEVSS